MSCPGWTLLGVLALPEPIEGVGAPDAILLRAVGDDRTGCAVVDLDVRCVVGRGAAAEEPLGMARRITLAEAATYELSVLTRGVPGRALEELVQQGALATVATSSTGVADPRGSAVAAVDGNGSTTWSADLSDVRPSIDLRWVRPQTIDSISIRVAADTAARAPETLELRWPDGRRQVELDEDGNADFPEIRTDQLTLDVDESEPATSVDFSGAAGAVPVGITELRLGGADGLPLGLGDEPLDLPCGTGPEIVTNDVLLRTSVTASAHELFEGAVVPAMLCEVETVALRSGDNILSATASDAFTPTSVVMHQGQLPLGSGGPVEGSSDGIGTQRLDPGPGQVVVVGHENANPGWVAQQGGKELAPITVDGWRQGWRTSGTPEEVTAEFAPGATYRWSLAIGALAVLVLLSLVLLVFRRRPGAGVGPAPERSVHPLGLVLGPLVGAVLAGPVGAAVALVVGGGVWLLSRKADVVARGLVALLVVPAVGVYAFLPWGGGGAWAGGIAWPSYVVVSVVSGLLVLVALDSRRPSRPLSRSAGTSTTR